MGTLKTNKKNGAGIYETACSNCGKCGKRKRLAEPRRGWCVNEEERYSVIIRRMSGFDVAITKVGMFCGYRCLDEHCTNITYLGMGTIPTTVLIENWPIRRH